MSEDRQKNWLKITCLGCAILPCLMGFATFGYIKYRISRAGDDLPAEVAKLKKMGVPTEAEDLKPNPPIPDAENAAIVYREIFKKMDALKALKEDPSIGMAMNSIYYEEYTDDHALAMKGLATRADILKLAVQAGTRPKCDFGRDYSQGAYTLFPEFSQMKTLAKLLALQAKFQAQAGDFDGALRSVRTGFAIEGHLSTEPTLIGALVAFAVDAITINSLEQVTVIGRNKPDFLAKSRKMLESLPALPDFRRSYSGELVMGRYAIRSLKSLRDLAFSTEGEWEDGPPPPSPLDKATIGDPSVRRMFEAKFVAKWRWVFENLPSDPTDWKGTEAVMDKLDASLINATGLEDRVNQIMFPIFKQATQALGLAQARRDVALLATRMLQDRSKGLPADLSGYGKLSLDPLTGNALGYEHKGKGFKIWSVDRDLNDDGGLKRIPGIKTNNRQFDFVWGFDYNFPVPPKPTEKRPISQGSRGGPGID